jgi:hypothetical protein
VIHIFIRTYSRSRLNPCRYSKFMVESKVNNSLQENKIETINHVLIVIIELGELRIQSIRFNRFSFSPTLAYSNAVGLSSFCAKIYSLKFYVKKSISSPW